MDGAIWRELTNRELHERLVAPLSCGSVTAMVGRRGYPVGFIVADDCAVHVEVVRAGILDLFQQIRR